MNAITVRTRPFDMANYLGTEEDVAEYLRQVRADDDPAEMAAALGDIARAHGMTQLAPPSGMPSPQCDPGGSHADRPSGKFTAPHGHTGCTANVIPKSLP